MSNIFKWYSTTDKQPLDYSKPIVAIDTKAGITYLLMPQLFSPEDRNRPKTAYQISGYNWFNTDTGKYDSACFFLTAEEAIKSRSGYTIRNVEIHLTNTK